MTILGETVKESTSDLIGFANKLNHVPVLDGADLTAVVQVVDASNPCVLQAVLAKQTRLAILILARVLACCIVEAININLTADRFIAQLAEQVHLCMHRASKYR